MDQLAKSDQILKAAHKYVSVAPTGFFGDQGPQRKGLEGLVK